MSIIYAMSDIHGCLEAFEEALSLVDLTKENTKLVLMGDYVHGGEDNYGVLNRIMKLEKKYGTDKVIVLAGNHEDWVCSGQSSINGYRYGEAGYDTNDDIYISWFRNLRRYYFEGNTIFIHAGINEEAGDIWKWGTDEYYMTEKYPAETGKFECGDKDIKIVAGHVGTAEISGDRDFHDIYFDGQSHYYIDGSTFISGIINVIKVDTEKDKFYNVRNSGKIIPYDYL